MFFRTQSVTYTLEYTTLCVLCALVRYSVVEKAITLRFVFFVHFCGGKSDHSTLCVLCALLWWKKRSLYALCTQKRAKRSLYALYSLCTFVVEKVITLRFVFSKKSEAITLRFVFFVHFCGGKSDHSTLCVLKKERSDHSTLCVLCALLWWKKWTLRCDGKDTTCIKKFILQCIKYKTKQFFLLSQPTNGIVHRFLRRLPSPDRQNVTYGRIPKPSRFVLPDYLRLKHKVVHI